MAAPFLTARWESLVLLNYRCPVDLLAGLAPPGTDLDTWDGSHLVSLVGFRFVDTRVKGIGVPCHRTFEEVNLRFYVRHTASDGIRRGVVFIRELVPRRAIAAVARLLYNEPYQAVAMTHAIDLREDLGGSATYAWDYRGSAHSLHASVSGAARELTRGSEAEFITEHYWGYTAQRGGRTLEYRVEHPPWRVWECDDAGYEKPSRSSLYGADFAKVLASDPVSAFVAVGSAVAVYPGMQLGAESR